MEFLDKFADTALVRWVAESDYGYPFVLTMHSIGMALVVGIVLVLNLRVLGLAAHMSLAGLRTFNRVIWIGLVCNVISGVLLFLANYTAFLHNTAFICKLVLLAVGGVATGILGKELHANDAAIADAPEVVPSKKARVLAIASIVIWLGAIAAGRIVGYTSVPE